MSTGEAFTAFVGFRVKLQTGKTITAQPLPFKKAIEYMARLARWKANPTYGGMEAELTPMVDEFASIIKLNEADTAAVEELGFLEAVDLIQTFFTLRRGKEEPTVIAEPEPPSSQSPSPSST